MSASATALPLRLMRELMLEVRQLWRRGAGEQHGARRYRRAALGSTAILASNGLKMLGSLVTMPLVLHFLGAERFGLWATLTSLMMLVGIGDLGIGNGLINLLSAANGADDRDAARIYVSSVFFLTLLLTTALLVVMLAIEAVIPWTSMFHLSSPVAIAEIRPAVTVLTLCIVLHVPLGVLARIRAGYQELHLSNLWQSVGTILGLAALVLFIWHGAGLPWLIAADAGGQAVALVANLGCLFLIERPWLRPGWRFLRLDAMREAMSLGLAFFTLAVLSIGAYYSDNLIAIWTCGPVAAGLFAICAKLFAPARLLAGTLLQPLWPAYGEAIARRDIAWVRRTLVLSIAGAQMLVLPVVLGLLLFGNNLASLWMRRPIEFGFGLLSGMTLWVLIETIGASMGFFLNAASIMRAQLIVASMFTVLAVALKVTLAKEFGIAGIPWGTLVAYVGVMLFPAALIVRRKIRELARGAGTEARRAPSAVEIRP